MKLDGTCKIKTDDGYVCFAEHPKFASQTCSREPYHKGKHHHHIFEDCLAEWS